MGLTWYFRALHLLFIFFVEIIIVVEVQLQPKKVSQIFIKKKKKISITEVALSMNDEEILLTL